MPTKNCASGDVDREVLEIEKRGGRAIQLVPVGDGAYKILYEEKTQRVAPGGKETRS